MRLTRFAITMLCACGLACAAAPEAGELAGTYAFSIATDTLHLEPSGHYRRVFVQPSAQGGFGTDTGRWWLSNDRRRVGLSAMPRRWPEHGRYDPVARTWHQPDTLMRGVVSLQIRSHWFGDLTLDVMPEVGWRYERVPPTGRPADY